MHLAGLSFLQTQMFKSLLSHLATSSSFAALPAAPRGEVWKRIKVLLTSPETAEQSAVIPAAERQAILEIARATVTGLPKGW